MSLMKYFTQKWCWDDLNDEQVKETSKYYDEHIDKIYSILTFPLKLLAKNINLHDGIVKKVILSRSENRLTLFGIFGDLEVGYYYMRINYNELKNFNKTSLMNIFSRKKIEILRDELDVLEDNGSTIFVHRFIFSNKSEFQINFCDCDLKIESAIPRDYSEKNCSLSGF